MNPSESLQTETLPLPPRPKIWKCGDRNQYTVPESKGDPWKTCLQPLLEEDRVKCERWEDEVQNLLLFAGLFSAVVTAFVVQSYQSLQEDPNQISITLLTTVVERLNQLSNNTPSASDSITEEAFYPSPSSIRINTFWFLSLILSLTTVLIGIVALQWIREYKRHPSNLSPKHTFATRNLRAEAFDVWFVPQILAGLPLLLQAALILFFAGLIDFLLALNSYVAIPVIGLIAVTLCFLFITTILPTLQAYWLLNTDAANTTSLPIQCPYKSPQSWAFLRLASSRTTRFMISYIGYVISCTLVLGFLTPIRVLIANFDPYAWKFIDYLQVSFNLKRLGTLQNWAQFDRFWLDERHRRVTSRPSKSCTYFTQKIGNIDYDAARGIAHIVDDGHTRDESVAFAVYHCFQQIRPEVIKDDIFELMSQSLPKWMTSQQATRKASMLEYPSVNMTREENEMFLLGHLPQTVLINPVHIFRKRQLELFVRTLAYIFIGDAWMDNPGVRYDLTVYSHLNKNPGEPGKLLIPVCMKTVQGISELPESLAEVIGEDPLQNSRVCYSAEMLRNFMEIMHIVTLSTIKSAREPSESSAYKYTGMTTLRNLTHCLKSLNNALNSGDSVVTQSIFHVSILYISCFHYTEWGFVSRWEPSFSAAFKELMTSIRLREPTFGVLQHYYRRRWQELVSEVLPRNLAPIPASVQPPAPAKLRFHAKLDPRMGWVSPNRPL